MTDQDESTTKETIRITLTSEAFLRLRMRAARRNMSVGGLVSELAEANLPAVPSEDLEAADLPAVLSRGAKSRARA